MENNEKNPHASALGQIKSLKKTQAARENAKQPRPNAHGPRKRKAIEDFECKCGGDTCRELTNCPRGRAIKRRNDEAELEIKWVHHVLIYEALQQTRGGFS